MDPDRRRKVASKGGMSQGKHNNPGNFANNKGRAAKAGAKGGSAKRK